MENNKQYKLGRIVDHDKRSLTFGFDATGLSIIDVEHKRLIPVLNQGNVGSCTGNAGIGAINTEPFAINTKVYSPDEAGALKLYHDAQVIDGGAGYPPEDNGSSGLSVAKALYNSGIISGFQHVFNLEDALKALSLYPIISGMNWFSNMFHPDADGRVHPIGTIAGGHEVEAFKVEVANGKIWFYNSWLNHDGSLWGVDGKFYLTWADFADLLSQQGDVTVLFPIVVTPPTPVYKTLRLGSKGELVKTLQTILNNNGAHLVVDGSFGNKTKVAVMVFQIAHGLIGDGVCGPLTWSVLNGTPNPKQAIIDIITKVCTDNGVEPLLGVSVATCESGLDPKATLYNPPSKSTDRGLFQWNNKYHPEITDSMAFDPTEATQLFCYAVKNGQLHAYWSASQPNWIKLLTPAIIAKYNL